MALYPVNGSEGVFLALEYNLTDNPPVLEKLYRATAVYVNNVSGKLIRGSVWLESDPTNPLTRDFGAGETRINIPAQAGVSVAYSADPESGEVWPGTRGVLRHELASSA